MLFTVHPHGSTVKLLMLPDCSQLWYLSAYSPSQLHLMGETESWGQHTKGGSKMDKKEQCMFQANALHHLNVT